MQYNVKHTKKKLEEREAKRCGRNAERSGECVMERERKRLGGREGESESEREGGIERERERGAGPRY